MPALTTKQILALRRLDSPPDPSWVEWACAMLVAGEDTPHLRILAGEVPPHEFFELRELADRAFRELGLPLPTTREQAGRAYMQDRVQQLLAGEIAIGPVLEEGMDLCVQLDHADFLSPFYSLHFAWTDLAEQDFQFYWPDMTPTNRDEVVLEACKSWLEQSQVD